MKTSRSRNYLRGFSHLLAALFSNASQFHREWDNYRPGPSSAADIHGRWQGRWISDANGHTGQLRAILARQEPGKYRASFHATYSKFLRVSYSVTLDAKEENGQFVLEGEADLGQLAGGVYHYQGAATPTEFNCTYRCEYDHGTFRMSRLD